MSPAQFPLLSIREAQQSDTHLIDDSVWKDPEGGWGFDECLWIGDKKVTAILEIGDSAVPLFGFVDWRYDDPQMALAELLAVALTKASIEAVQ